MDTVESTGGITGDTKAPSLWEWICGIVARLTGASVTARSSLKPSSAANAKTARESEEENFIVAPGGYRIRVPDENGRNHSAGEMIPSVREALTAVPPLPHVVLELIREIQNPNSTASSIAEIAASDPAMAAALLRTVNSAACGLSRKVTSVGEAISYLGFATVRSIVIGLRLEQAFPRMSGQAAIDAQDLWVHSLAVSYVADCLAQRVPGVDRGLASTLGLLHDIGKLAIVARLGGNPPMGEAKNTDPATESTQAREARAFGVDHAGLGAALANRWGLPSDLVQAIRCHHVPEKAFEASDPPALRQAVYLVHVANELAKYAYPYSEEMELDPSANESCKSLALGDSVAKLLDGKVRAAITRAILLAAENESASGAASRPAFTRRFLRLRHGDEAAKLGGSAQDLRRILVDEAKVESALNARSEAGAVRAAGATTSGKIEMLITDALAQQQALPLSQSGRAPAAFTLRALLSSFADSTGDNEVEIVQSVENGKLQMAIRSDALSFVHRLGTTGAAKGPSLVEAELSNVLNLDWFESIAITPDGSGWLFRGH